MHLYRNDNSQLLHRGRGGYRGGAQDRRGSRQRGTLPTSARAESQCKLLARLKETGQPESRMRSVFRLLQLLPNTTLRVTPAIEAGLTDHVWALEELATSKPTSLAARTYMRLSAEEAILQFSKWKQDKSQLRLILSISSVSLSVSGSSKVLEASFAECRFIVKIGDFEFNFLALDADFEYAELREVQLSSFGLSQANCVCCLTVTFREFLKQRGLPDAALMICELRED